MHFTLFFAFSMWDQDPPLFPIRFFYPCVYQTLFPFLSYPPLLTSFSLADIPSLSSESQTCFFAVLVVPTRARFAPSLLKLRDLLLLIDSPLLSRAPYGDARVLLSRDRRFPLRFSQNNCPFFHPFSSLLFSLR